MSEIIIYKSKDGHIELDINLADETLWLSQQQMADSFRTKPQAITKHLKNIFISGEIDEDSVCSVLEHTATDGKTYRTKFYSLDATISVGYRVNSSQATQFRIWATNILKEHLIKGYTTYEKRLAERGIKELQQISVARTRYALRNLHKIILETLHLHGLKGQWHYLKQKHNFL